MSTNDNTRTPGEGAPGPGEPGDDRLIAIGREVDRTARRVGEVETLLRQLAADVTHLARFVGDGSPEPGGHGDDSNEAGRVPGVRAWLLASDPDQASADLADLIGWLDRVYLSYHGTALPSCWMWHPDVIEELWWLRCAHADAYHPKNGSWLRVGDWHDRQRPGVVNRIRRATQGCELALHTPDNAHTGRPARTPLAEAAEMIAAWNAAGRPSPAPEPSPAQLAAADAYDQALHRSRR